MTREDMIRKLTSRKFWLALAGFVAGLVVAFNGTAATAETISGCIMSLGSVVAYTIGEGLADSSPTLNEEINYWNEEEAE